MMVYCIYRYKELESFYLRSLRLPRVPCVLLFDSGSEARTSSEILYNQRGTALGAMVVVLTLITILTAGVVRLVAMRSGAAMQKTYHLQAQYAAQAGLAHARWQLARPGGLRPIFTDTDSAHTVIEDAIAEETGYTVRLRPYGGYIEAIASGRCYRESVTVRVLLGMKPPAWFSRAITLQPSPYPLVMAGRSRIRGDVLAGRGGVRSGRIPGDPLPPQTPEIDGQVLQTGDRVEFDPWLFIATMTALDRHLDGEDITHTYDDLDVFGEMITPRAFSDSLKGGVIHLTSELVLMTAAPDDPPLTGPITLVADGEIRLQGDLKLRGPVIVAAKDGIRVTDRVDIQGGLLYSPGVIRLTDDARLEGQALSRYHIEVADRAQVEYPGVLFATGKIDCGRREGGVTISSSRRQTASMLVQAPSGLLESALNQTVIRIDPQSSVAGLVYSVNYTWLTGQLLGTVATGLFYLKHGPTSYINWMKDGEIDRLPLTEDFRLPLFFGARPVLERVAWEWLEQ